ncbi:MAG TPA: dienelactone hydrolase family protein [Candidatus Binataceae bacterium]|nr:dienelactone hydrolase family protein [Candidatus Binataceae bacterium]
MSADSGAFRLSRWQIAAGLIVVALAILLWLSSRGTFDRSSHGEFNLNGTDLEEFHCAPKSNGPHPAVMLIHGAGYRGQEHDDFDAMCAALADHGYYAEFIEYYDATPNSDPTTDAMDNFKAWTAALRSGVEWLARNPAVEPKRIALMGFSQGAYLAVGVSAQFPDEVAAVVEYYGGLIPQLRDKAASMPPTLIIHGEADSVVPVSEAKDLDALLTKANRPHEMHLYPGVDHGFNFRRPAPSYNRAASDAAWKCTFDFLDRTLK